MDRAHGIDAAAPQPMTADGADTPDAPARIVPESMTLFRQRRPMGLRFARAFLTDQHIAPTGRTPAALWADLETRAAGADAVAIGGTFDWALLSVRRGGPARPMPDGTRLTPIDIVHDGPSEL